MISVVYCCDEFGSGDCSVFIMVLVVSMIMVVVVVVVMVVAEM